MVDKPNPIQPQGTPKPVDSKETTKVPGGFQFHGEHKFGNLKFSEAEWNKLMNVCIKSLNDYMNKTFKKMTERMKKDWKRARGENPD